MKEALTSNPVVDQLDELWAAYQRLILAQLADPRLAADRKHVEAAIWAHSAYAAEFRRVYA